MCVDNPAGCMGSWITPARCKGGCAWITPVGPTDTPFTVPFTIQARINKGTRITLQDNPRITLRITFRIIPRRNPRITPRMEDRSEALG